MASPRGKRTAAKRRRSTNAAAALPTETTTRAKKARKGSASKQANDAPSTSQDASRATSEAVDPLEAAVALANQPRNKHNTIAAQKAAFLAKYGGKSPEEILDSLSSKWRSDVYNHFHPPKIERQAGGKIMHVFVCKTNPDAVVSRADYDNSTGNLARHRKECEATELPEAEMMEKFAHGVTYTPGKLRFTLALWCARRHRPFSIVEDAEFQSICKMLYPQVKIPSRITVGRDVQLVHRYTKVWVIKMLQEVKGKVSLSLDGWTSPNVYSFLGVTVHWLHGTEIRTVILDFVKLTKSHTGVYLAQMLRDTLRQYGIEEKVLGVTCDNAENNATLLRELEKLVVSIRGGEIRVRCFDHILNLVCKGVLSQFKKGRKANQDVPDDLSDDVAQALKDLLAEQDDGDKDEDDEVADPAREAADEAVIESIDKSNPEVLVSRHDFQTGQLAILALSSKVWWSPTVREELGKLAVLKHLNAEVLVRPVATRWNSCTMTFKRALEMREVLTDLCDMAQFNVRSTGSKSKGMRLRDLTLENEEWEIITQLHGLLDAFLFATIQMSANTKALVHEVIPYIDLLTEHLDKKASDPELHSTIRAAAQRGRIILNRYYSRTDESIIFRVAMVMHPRYKLKYFKDHEWKPKWIQVAEQLVREEWVNHYKPKPSASAPASSITSRSATSRQPSTRSKVKATPETEALFASMDRRAAPTDYDALKAYLEAPPVMSVSNSIEYWVSQLGSPSDGPLARMALDFLIVPATSCEAERSWARIPGLVPEDEVMAKIDPKGKSKALNVNPEPVPEPTRDTHDSEDGEDGDGADPELISIADSETGTGLTGGSVPPTSGTDGEELNDDEVEVDDE